MLCAFLKSLPVIYLHFKTPSPAKLGIKGIQKSIWNCRLHERIRIIYVLLFHRMVCDSVQAYFRCMHKSTHSLLHIIYGPPWCQTHFGDKAVGLNATFSKGMREWTRTPPPPNPLSTAGSADVALNFYFTTDPRVKRFFHTEIKMGGIGFVLTSFPSYVRFLASSLRSLL